MKRITDPSSRVFNGHLPKTKSSRIRKHGGNGKNRAGRR